MKKLMLFAAIMVVALAVGSAYADGSTTWALTHSGNESGNGITVFSTAPVDFDNIPLGAAEMRGSYEEGSAAGGWREEEAAVTEPNNGVTIFIAGPVDFETLAVGTELMIGVVYEEGSAAGGLHEEEALAPGNGITIFSDGPADW